MNTFIRVSPHGNVTQSLRLTVTASCPMDFRYFPMDSQLCQLQIESFGYTTRDIFYEWAGGLNCVGIASGARSLPQFSMRGHREFKVESSLSTGNYSRLIVEFFFERSLGYYIIQVYVPSALIVLLSEISFWISRESSPARVSLGITTVLTMTTLISSTNASLPKISYLKAIDVYLVICFIMVFAALLEYAAVAYTGKRCKLKKQKRKTRRRQFSMTSTGSNKKITTPLWDFDSSSSSDEESCCEKCKFLCSKASDIEKYSRVLFPTAFICFNIVYWVSYLNISNLHNSDSYQPVFDDD